MENYEELEGSISAELLPKGVDNYILRGHPEGKGYGSGIHWTAVVSIDGNIGTVKILSSNSPGKKLSRKQYISIGRWIISKGVTEVKWSRRQNNTLKEITKVYDR